MSDAVALNQALVRVSGHITDGGKYRVEIIDSPEADDARSRFKKGAPCILTNASEWFEGSHHLPVGDICTGSPWDFTSDGTPILFTAIAFSPWPVSPEFRAKAISMSPWLRQ